MIYLYWGHVKGYDKGYIPPLPPHLVDEGFYVPQLFISRGRDTLTSIRLEPSTPMIEDSQKTPLRDQLAFIVTDKIFLKHVIKYILEFPCFRTIGNNIFEKLTKIWKGSF